MRCAYTMGVVVLAELLPVPKQVLKHCASLQFDSPGKSATLSPHSAIRLAIPSRTGPAPIFQSRFRSAGDGALTFLVKNVRGALQAAPLVLPGPTTSNQEKWREGFN